MGISIHSFNKFLSSYLLSSEVPIENKTRYLPQWKLQYNGKGNYSDLNSIGWPPCMTLHIHLSIYLACFPRHWNRLHRTTQSSDSTRQIFKWTSIDFSLNILQPSQIQLPVESNCFILQSFAYILYQYTSITCTCHTLCLNLQQE